MWRDAPPLARFPIGIAVYLVVVFAILIAVTYRFGMTGYEAGVAVGYLIGESIKDHPNLVLAVVGIPALWAAWTLRNS